ncbi:MAG TPA: UbiA prenyltransferase family protein [Rhodopila sp.]|nr:UbiA prenyltransferase family protein [Rhodopila sp.]
MSQRSDSPPSRARNGALRDYIRIARPDHWVKNIFMIPGAALAFVLVHRTASVSPGNLLLAVVSLCLVASANYTINEYLDAPFDRFHPLKRHRPGAEGRLDVRLVMAQYAALSVVGLGLAAAINPAFLVTSAWLLAMGVIYNVQPLRTKDRQYLDVLSESVNNPIRFLLGWFAITGAIIPPGSVLLAYWMGGAFLMGTKRYSEYRRIGDPQQAGLYRRSFQHYTEQSLLLSSFFYALCSAFLIGVFLIKYKIELLLSFPFFAVLFTWYLAIALKGDSAAQAPEKLYRERAFMAFAALTFAAVVALFFTNLPALNGLMRPYYIHLGPS